MRRLAFAAVLLAAPAPRAGAGALLSRQEALALAFPAGTAVEKRTGYLDKEQVEAAKRLARAPVDSRVWTYYVGSERGAVVGYAYLDTFTVRTMPATVLAALAADGRLRFMEVLSFNEPEDYMPPDAWLKTLRGRALDADLRVQGGLRNVAGATLTAHAFAESARRVLAVHRTLHP